MKKYQLFGIVCDAKDCSTLQKKYKNDIFKHKKVKPIRDYKEKKIILLKYEKIEEIPKEITEIVPYEIEIDEKDLSYHEILREIIPKEIKEIPTSFETIGHIAHLNLKEEFYPYKEKIGNLIIEKNPNIKTVVNKLSSIESKFREFKMEVLAGKEDFMVKVIEHGNIFEFDYSKVYWNSRLATEHQRIAKLFTKDDIVVDMFAGVGPFAIPSGEICKVYANDLNPKSYEYLVKNVKLNSVEYNVECFNLDACEFIKEMIKKKIGFNHILMNLPKTANEFLYIFKDLIPTSYYKIHCHFYCFVKDINEGKEMIEKELGNEIEYVNVHHVRNVSPKKEMYCYQFLLPKICFQLSQEEQESKKNKLN